MLETVDYQPNSWHLYSRVTLSPADANKERRLASLSFSVDRQLIKMLRAGDVVNITYTYWKTIGLSVIREGKLICAIGAVYSVPLGHGVAASFPAAMIEEAEAIFQKLDPTYCIT